MNAPCGCCHCHPLIRAVDRDSAGLALNRRVHRITLYLSISGLEEAVGDFLDCRMGSDQVRLPAKMAFFCWPPHPSLIRFSLRTPSRPMAHRKLCVAISFVPRAPSVHYKIKINDACIQSSHRESAKQKLSKLLSWRKNPNAQTAKVHFRDLGFGKTRPLRPKSQNVIDEVSTEAILLYLGLSRFEQYVDLPNSDIMNRKTEKLKNVSFAVWELGRRYYILTKYCYCILTNVC